MFRRIYRLACPGLFALLFAASAHAQTDPSQTSGIVLRFHNGSVIQPAMLLDFIEMKTKIGKLSIPAHEVQRIDFGFRLADEDSRKIDQALIDLGSDSFQAREMAKKSLLALGRLAYPALVDASKSGNLETAKRVDIILKDLRAKLSPERLQTRRSDIVRTSDSAVAGEILSTSLRVRCDLFGEVTIPVLQLRELRMVIPGTDITVAVDANKYGNMSTWLETEFEVALGTRLEISASGEINLDPGGAVGNPALTRGVRPDGTRQLNSGESYVPGQLLGRIGADGPTFVIGPRFSGAPDREGKLFLRICTLEHANNIRSEGSFQVRISSEPY